MKLKSKIFLFGILLCTNTLLSQSVSEIIPTIVINEINESPNSVGTFIELLVISRSNIPILPEDEIPPIIIDDSNEFEVQEGYISVESNLLKDLSPGQLIVVHDIPDLQNQIEDIIYLNINGPGILKWNTNPNPSNPTYHDAELSESEDQLINEFISFSGQGDIIQLKLGENFSNIVPLSSARNYSLSERGISSYSDLTATMGFPNNLENEIFIDRLKSLNNFRISCNSSVSNSLDITIEGGVPPYTISTKNTEAITYSLFHSVFNLPCGQNVVTVVDSEGQVRKCEGSIKIDNYIPLRFCEGEIEDGIELKDFICPIYHEFCGEMVIGELEIIKFESFIDVSNIFINSDEIITIYFSGRDGTVVEEIIIDIELFFDGEACDDFDDCTVDDKYVNCNCQGESSELTAKIEGNKYLCFEETTSELTVIVNGGIGDYTILWSDGSSESTTIANIETSTLYTVSVIDESGCHAIASIELNQSFEGDYDGDGICDDKDPCDDNNLFPCISNNTLYNDGFDCVPITLDNSEEPLCISKSSCTNLNLADFTIKIQNLEIISPSENDVDIQTNGFCAITDWEDNLTSNLVQEFNSQGINNGLLIITNNDDLCCSLDNGTSLYNHLYNEIYTNAENVTWVHIWDAADGQSCMCVMSKRMYDNYDSVLSLLQDPIPDVEKPKCQTIDDSQIQSTTFHPNSIDILDTKREGNVQKFCDVDVEDSGIDYINQVIDNARNSYGIDMNFIISADCVDITSTELPSFQSESIVEATIAYNAPQNTDITVWVHKNADGTVTLCSKVNSSFSYYKGNDFSSMINETINHAAGQKKSDIESSVELEEDQDGFGGEPSFMGKRSSYDGKVNFWSVCTQIGGNIGFLAEKGTLSPLIWDKTDDGTVMFDVSGAVAGPLTGLVEENPIAGIIQLGNLVKAAVASDVDLAKIIEAAKDYQRIFKSIIKNVKDDLSGVNGVEKAQYSRGKTMIAFIAGATALLKISQAILKAASAKKASKALQKELKDYPNNLGHPFHQTIKNKLTQSDAQLLFKQLETNPKLKEYLIDINPVGGINAWKKLDGLDPRIRAKKLNLETVLKLDQLVLHSNPIEANKLIRNIIEGVDQIGGGGIYVLNKIKNGTYDLIPGYQNLIKGIKKTKNPNSNIAHEVGQTFKHIDNSNVPNSQKVLGHK